MKSKLDRLELHALGLDRQVQRLEAELGRDVCNVVWMSPRFEMREACGPRPIRFTVPFGASPIGLLTASGISASA